MYIALARKAGRAKSRANSSRASTTMTSEAPQASPRARNRSSSTPWPTSTAIAITSAPYLSLSQPIATEVSSPPEYASTHRSVTSCSLRCVLFAGHRLETPSHRPARNSFATDDEDRVVPRDRRDDVLHFPSVDRARDGLRAPGRCPQHNERPRRLHL